MNPAAADAPSVVPQSLFLLTAVALPFYKLIINGATGQRWRVLSALIAG